MKCPKLVICIGVAFAALLPVLLNAIIGLNHPHNIMVVGDPSTWINFYGSYIGGVLTAIIGFLALLKETKENRRELQVSYQEKVVASLEQTLSQCVSLFDFSRLGIISMYLNDKSKYDAVLHDLDMYYYHVTTTANAWGVLYSGREEKEIQEFQSVYHQCVTDLTHYINKITELIVQLKNDNKEETENIILRIKEVLDKRNEYHELLQSLFYKARVWLDMERNKLKQLQKK